MEYDLIIVGLGMSAGPVVKHLLSADAKLRVLVVDAGEEWDPSESIEHVGSNPHSKYTIQIQSDRCETDISSAWWSCSKAGGSSNLWYGQLSRFESKDFDGASTETKWPYGYAELRRYYNEIESELKPFGPPRELKLFHECEIYTPRPLLSHFERELLRHLQICGFSPYVGMTCLGGPVWHRRPVDPTTLHLIEPHHRNMLRPSYYRTIYGDLKRSRWEVRFATEVVSLLTSGGKISGVSLCDSQGKLFAANARKVVLCCGPLRTVPLLYTLPKQRPQIGAGFTFTVQASGYILTNIRRSKNQSDELAGSFASICSRNLGAGSYEFTAGGKIAIYDALNFDGFEKTEKKLKKLKLDCQTIMDHARSHYLLKISYKGYSKPWENKRILKSSPGLISILYHPHPIDIKTMQDIPGLFTSIANALPGGQMLAAMAPDEHDWQSAHQHGGACFSDSEHSLVTSTGEYRDYDGLFIVDSSTFPTSGSTNTSHTIMANALRCAHHISRHMSEFLNKEG